ncbi:MAG: gamma carbonic anhydrase family protein [Syntrophomonas sp.]|jgi:carbonic anhydrase/acetyltransferase-like protein (isoleucine patch superfamily)|nr:gamma carbonic anhydrase family protein [Syntrophomonas sp.]
MPLYEFEGKRPSIPQSTFVHPDAVVIGDVVLGEGCLVGAGAVIRGDFGRIIIGSGSNVQDNCVIHVDINTEAIIHDNVLIGHGAIVHGPCIINEYAVIGMGAIVSMGCEIGPESILAAGSLLPNGRVVPPRKVAMGNPATTMKDLSDKNILMSKEGLKHYQKLTKRCIDGLKLIDN